MDGGKMRVNETSANGVKIEERKVVNKKLFWEHEQQPCSSCKRGTG